MQRRETYRRIALVLLAAGDSRRFGANKLLAKIDGKPMYRCLADEVRSLPEDLFFRKLVVSQYDEILEDLSGCGFEAVKNRRSDLGISHSIHLAIQQLSKGDRPYTAVCFAVCDQPWLRGETVMKLIYEWEKSQKGLGCLFCRGRDGNPAVFAGSYEKELLSLTGDVGGRVVIHRHEEDLFRYEIADSRELEDVDVREALDSYVQDSYGQNQV